MSRRPTMTPAAIGLLGVLVLAGCGDAGPSRADAVGELTTTAVPERFRGVADAASGLSDDVAAWCAGGDAEAVLTATAETREAWVAQTPFWSGPVMDRRSRFLVDPTVTPEAVRELTAGTQAVDARFLQDLAGADQRGLGAIESLVADAPSGAVSDRACAYAAGAAELVATETAAVADEWLEYGPELAADDETANMAIRDMVSDALGAVRIVKDDPGLPGNAGRVAGVRWLLVGDGTVPGLAPLLSEATVAQLTAEMDAGAVNEYERTIATGVVGELGITVNFSDADGDG